MLIRKKEVDVKPLLVSEFNELRDLYDDYLTSAIYGDGETVMQSCADLLLLALSRTSESLATDAALPKELDSNQVHEIVSLAAGDLKNSLQVRRQMILENVSKYMALAINQPDVEKQIEDGLLPSPPSPEPSPQPSQTSKPSTSTNSGDSETGSQEKKTAPSKTS